MTAAAAIWDIRSRRIPNLLCLALGIVAIAYSYLAGSWDLLGSSALHALVALVVGIGLFAIGFIGAGDAKLYSTAAFALPLGKALPMLGWTSVTGLGVLIVMAIARRAMGLPLRKDGKGFTVPYGVAISGGFWITTLT